MPAVLDVSFLARPDISSPIIYRYRDGLLVPRVRQTVQEMLKRSGGGLRGATADTIVQSISDSSLFDEYITFCEWPKKRSRTLARLADGVLEVLCAGGSNGFILFAPENANLFDSGAWPRAAECCLVVEEAVVSAAWLPAIMKYYWSVTDLPNCPIDRDAIQRKLLKIEFEKRYAAPGQFFKPSIGR